MSGHSKWANIKNRKGAQDKKRSEAFTKVSKNIMTAIREGGGNCNPESNTALREAIDRSRAVNMPKENIDRLIQNRLGISEEEQKSESGNAKTHTVYFLDEEGFKLFSELSGNERVLTMDPDTMVAEYVYPDKYHVYDYDGELAYYDADNLNFAVTPNHRFFYSTRKMRMQILSF